MTGVLDVIVTWKAAAVLRKDLAPPFASRVDGPLDAWFVDNASADGSHLQAICVLIHDPANGGWAPAVDQGLRRAYQELGTFLLDHAEAAVAEPRLVGPDGVIQGSARRDPAPLGAQVRHRIGATRARRPVRSPRDFHRSAYRHYREQQLKERFLLVPPVAAGRAVSLTLRLPEAIQDGWQP